MPVPSSSPSCPDVYRCRSARLCSHQWQPHLPTRRLTRLLTRLLTHLSADLLGTLLGALLVGLLLSLYPAAPVLAAAGAPYSTLAPAAGLDERDRHPRSGAATVGRAGLHEALHESLPDAVETVAGQSVDINLATSAELAAALPGIGPGKAQNIIDWREANGPFQRIEQLLEVSGIGPKTLEKIRPLVRIGDAVSWQRTLQHRQRAEGAVVRALGAVVAQAVQDRAQAVSH